VVGNASPSGVGNVDPALIFGAALGSLKKLVSGVALFLLKVLVSFGQARQFNDRSPIPKL